MNSYIYQTKFPVTNYRGEELLPAGSILDDATLQKLSVHSSGQDMFPVGFSPTVIRDLEGFLDNPPYSSIFSKTDTRAYVFSMLKTVHISRNSVEVAEYFRDKDFYTYRHMLVVFAISAHIVSLLMPTYDCSKIIASSFAHDIGKCSVPLDLLGKKRALTHMEHEYIQHHTLAGFALTHYYSNDETTDLTSRVARDHHERLDGTGYPAGITAIDRMIEIVIASDMYDALISSRPYRSEPYNNRCALEELSSKVLLGKISKETVQALVASNRKADIHWSDCVISVEKREEAPVDNYHGIRVESQAEAL